jgi:hypothetical protein
MDKYVDVLRGWLDDPKSTSRRTLQDNYMAARLEYPVSQPRSPIVYAGLDACFESCLTTNTWALAKTAACIDIYDLEVAKI